MGKDADAEKDLRQKRVAEDEMVGWQHSVDMNLSKFWETVKDRGACQLQPIGSQRVSHNLAAERHNHHHTFAS